MSEPDRVRVVVPTRNRRDSVLRLLSGLEAQTLGADRFEVVVAADGCRDGTAEAVAARAGPVTVSVVAHARRGRAATVNAAVSAPGAAFALIVVLDDDMTPTPGLLAAHVAAHERPERVGVVGSAPVILDASTVPFARFMGGRFNDVLAELERRGELGYAQVYTGNFSVRRADFEAVGGYDAGFTGYGLEDYEFALRLRDTGVRFVLAPQARADQHYDKGYSQAAADSRSRGHAAVRFARLHPEAASVVTALSGPPHPSPARRAIRKLFPPTAAILPVAARALDVGVARAERHAGARLGFVYELALELHFLIGLREAGAAEPAPGR